MASHHKHKKKTNNQQTTTHQRYHTTHPQTTPIRTKFKQNPNNTKQTNLDDSIATRNFLRHLGRLMAAAGVKDFAALRDVFKPEPPRLRRHLSAVVNFAKFR